MMTSQNSLNTKISNLAYELNIKEILSLIKCNSYDILNEDEDGANPLHKAVSNVEAPGWKIASMITMLFIIKPDIINTPSIKLGETALFWAIDKKNTAAILTLIALGANKDYGLTYNPSWTPIKKAKQVDDKTVLDLINMPFEDAKKGYNDLMKQLLQKDPETYSHIIGLQQQNCFSYFEYFCSTMEQFFSLDFFSKVLLGKSYDALKELAGNLNEDQSDLS